MATYHYTAIDQNGKKVTGSLAGDTARQIRASLRGQGLNPLEVKALSQTAQTSRLFGRQKISLTDLALVTRQFATLVQAGVPIAEALQAVTEQVTKPPVRTLMQGVRDKVIEGYSLADAFRQYPSAFSELYCATVAAGEQTGRLDLILNRLAEYTEQQQAMRRKVRLALIYPSIMTLISASIVTFLLIYVVPRIIDVFTSTGQALPEITQVLLAISGFIRDYGLYCLVVIIGLVFLGQKMMKNTSYKRSVHRLLWRIPIIGFTIRTINSARFTRTLGILIAAGVDLINALRVATALVGHLPMKESIQAANEKVREGTSLHLALNQTKVFEPMVIHLIANGEASGRLPDMLDYVANYQDAEVSRLIDTSLTLFEPILILMMGMVVLFIVLAILLPIFELGQIIT